MQWPVQSEVITDLEAVRELKIEIEVIDAQCGPNPYTNYLRKHGKRPSQKEAALLGRVLGGRVKADDGSMQPSFSPAERRARKSEKEAFARRYEQILRLKVAIAALADNRDDPAEVIGDGCFLLENVEIVAQIDAAVRWLTRFAEAWHGRSQQEQVQK